MMYSKKKDLYPIEEFYNPGKEYRSAPFWAWNCELEKGVMEEQIKCFHEMGFGGFHCHVRTGMDTPYLTDEFMEFIKFARDKGKENDLLMYLYDEDRWPSGTAGGSITKEIPQYRLQYLVFTTEKMERGRDRAGGVVGTVYFRQKDEAKLTAAFDIQLEKDGSLKKYRKWTEGETVEGTLWYVYQMEGDSSEWFNRGTYLDTMNQEAVQEFVNRTHERYKEVLENDFGTSIKSIFTDEPQVLNKVTLSFAEEKKDCWLPWTWDFPVTFQNEAGINILEYLPELVWELPDGKISKVRYEYHNHVAERFVRSYVDTIGKWCEENNLFMTGHMLKEPTLESQTQAMGDVMRGYRSMHLPGIDMLHNLYEYNTAKQCQSMVRQKGCEGMTCEIYGVTGWDFDFRGFKLQGNWLAALGVTFRVPHLAWMSMKGEAKRDYPPSISYQSPWYKKFRVIEEHFARLNTVLTRGKAKADVAVIHPVESYWIHYGPSSQTKAVRDRLERHFSELTEILLFGLVDFDFISESCLTELYQGTGTGLKVGEMSYRTVIVPDCETIRKTTLGILKEFQRAKGRVIFLSGCPRYVDAVESDEAYQLFEKAEKVSFDSASVLEALEDERFIDVRDEKGGRANFLLYQLREEEHIKWLFLTGGKEPESKDVDPCQRLTITINGEYKTRLYDTDTGEIKDLRPERYEHGKTVFERTWHMHDSLLLELTEGKEEVCTEIEKIQKPKSRISRIFNRVPITLSEPNACLLDYAEYSMDGRGYQPIEELLKIDNLCRKKLGIPLRRKNVCQPYMMKKTETEILNRVYLRFKIESEIRLEQIHLVLESPELFEIVWNGEQIEAEADGYYVDRSIQTIPLPGLRKGVNILEICEPIAEWTNMEWCYLLGDFGVCVEGLLKTITEPVKEMAFCDYSARKLPFYTGNITWHTEVDIKENERLAIRVPAYRGALISVFVDGKETGDIIYSPYLLELPELQAGMHKVDFKLYGNRENGFAQLHHEKTLKYKKAPNSWRSEGDLWADEYQLTPMGILRSPEFIYMSKTEMEEAPTDNEITNF
ncbi:type 1 glutamine amidotransferase family protein [Mediterraneibacter agrestimuris]|uniref:hypothetical protein n=1 Tax=Mediterraneibacter agrestimuris TaxID=2941333 RepID=UPI002040103B|nr:hypothetical protein [Mediterraneibacter agrestimuris]